VHVTTVPVTGEFPRGAKLQIAGHRYPQAENQGFPGTRPPPQGVGMKSTNEQDRPLLISSRLSLIDEVVRLASSSALEVHVAADIGSALSHWFTAPLVIVGSDALVDEIPGRRARVIVVHDCDSSRNNDDAADTAVQRDVWRFAVELGAEHVVELPDGQRWLLDAFRECAEGPVRGGVVVPVLAGSGGVGASTLCANLAVVGSQLGARSLVVDADPWGGGIDLLMGAEEVTGARWPDLRQVSGHLPAGHLEASLPRVADVSILSCARDGNGPDQGPSVETMAAVLRSARRSHDLVIVDCPSFDGHLLSVVLEQASHAVLVVSDHVRPTAAAARRNAWLRPRVPRVLLVQASTPRGVTGEDISHALGAEFHATLPFVPSMTTRADDGELPALPKAYVHACRSILEEISKVDRLRAA
jgi:secretion/DNA translocation related CpaE-like protein